MESTFIMYICKLVIQKSSKIYFSFLVVLVLVFRYSSGLLYNQLLLFFLVKVILKSYKIYFSFSVVLVLVVTLMGCCGISSYKFHL